MVRNIDKIGNDQNYTPQLFSSQKSGKLNSVFATNPFMPTKTEKAQEQKETEMEKALSGVNDAETRKAIQEAYNNGDPSRAFVDMLIQRHEKHQQKFEAAWSEYQSSKNNLQFYKKLSETMTTKYEDSESNFEQGLMTRADKNFRSADMSTDMLLDKASMIAHSIFG